MTTPMTLQQVADNLANEEGRAYTPLQVWKIEQRALSKLRKTLRANPAIAEDLWAFIEGNPQALERGAFQPVRLTRYQDPIATSEISDSLFHTELEPLMGAL